MKNIIPGKGKSKTKNYGEMPNDGTEQSASTDKTNNTGVKNSLSKDKNTLRNTIITILIIVVLGVIFFHSFASTESGTKVSFPTIVKDAKEHKLKSVVKSGDVVTATKKDGGAEYAYFTDSSGFYQFFTQNGINILGNDPLITQNEPQNPPDITSIITIIITIFIVIVTFMFLRQMRQAGGGIFSMGESKAKLFVGKKQNITFDSVAGVDEAKKELEEIVQFLKFPKKFTALGARIPRGVLLVGQPGTGKTLLAKAIAGESGVPFFSVAGSEFEEMLVGAGASRVRDLFSKARKAAPCIIFIDEIDSIGRRRGTILNSGHTEQTLNQILVEMDGFDSSTNIILIGATNRPDVLDPALLRPGRFDRTVTLDIPDMNGRLQILAIHAKNKPLEPELSLNKIARRTVGFSGADLENMLNEAAIIAAKENKTKIGEAELEEAATKVVMGPAKNRMSTDKEKTRIAYHEVGHALVSKFLPQSDPVHRISIIPRGMSGGSTMYLPESDSMLSTKTYMLSKIVHAMGGYAAEKLIYNDVTNGASNDIQQATKLAKRMVMQYGMSENLGPVLYNTLNDIESGVGEGEKSYSEQTAFQIDTEVRNIVSDGYTRAFNILTEFRYKLDQIVEILLKQENIEGAEFDQLVSDVVS